MKMDGRDMNGTDFAVAACCILPPLLIGVAFIALMISAQGLDNADYAASRTIKAAFAQSSYDPAYQYRLLGADSYGVELIGEDERGVKFVAGVIEVNLSNGFVTQTGTANNMSFMDGGDVTEFAKSVAAKEQVCQIAQQVPVKLSDEVIAKFPDRYKTVEAPKAISTANAFAQKFC